MRHPVNREHHENLSWSVRVAETVTQRFGSLQFVIIQTLLILTWIAYNAWVVASDRFDPYPFILLNLAFSTQAAYAAPLILLGQNRQAEKDRLMAEHDYAHNAETLALLRHLHTSMHGDACHVEADLPLD